MPKRAEYEILLKLKKTTKHNESNKMTEYEKNARKEYAKAVNTDYLIKEFKAMQKQGIISKYRFNKLVTLLKAV